MKKFRGWHVSTDYYCKAPTLAVRRGMCGAGFRVRLLPWRLRGLAGERSWWGRPPIDRAAWGFKLRVFGLSFGMRRYRSVATHFGFGLVDISILHGLH